MPFKRQKSNVSPHYHDTRTLLRKYRDVMWNLEVSDLDLQEEFKAEYGLSTDALFVDNEVNKGGNRLENYARALERSKRMMQIIDTAIDLMRRKHKKGEFYYWILYYAYLSPQQCENAGAILQSLESKGISISLRTYYVHRDEAIEVLSSILWGYTSQDCYGSCMELLKAAFGSCRAICCAGGSGFHRATCLCHGRGSRHKQYFQKLVPDVRRTASAADYERMVPKAVRQHGR